MKLLLKPRPVQQNLRLSYYASQTLWHVFVNFDNKPGIWNIKLKQQSFFSFKNFKPSIFPTASTRFSPTMQWSFKRSEMTHGAPTAPPSYRPIIIPSKDPTHEQHVLQISQKVTLKWFKMGYFHILRCLTISSAQSYSIRSNSLWSK